ncbi:TetR/AcrR family transcriptional regulator [Cellulomonas xylanilytica]|uniref:Putative TetR-family transcriptional regulator n=1 Tax=Cellulomonas xylanilytica TaxID=233583 RepID=A0A510V8C9_9CELL|nr:TetR/AcrR family transcriptional regulator [Cellulomonas xylanilytica]GEK21405.1 putative TetR-family transcriptional regulator [Cellulomonas xylanilytica]
MDDATPVTARRPGRRRDESKDDAILQATRELLAERGFDGMTMDAVADRAGAGKATVYRRWPSKVQLTVDAIVCTPGIPTTADDIPDTGSLRSDLLSVRFGRKRSDDAELMSGVMSAVRENPDVAAAFQQQFVRSRVSLMRGLLERAQERGELRPDVDLDMVSAVAPAMIAYRKMVAGQRVDDAFVEQMIDSVILPLVTGP